MNLARERNKRKLTQQQLAAFLGAFRGAPLSQSQVAYWEGNKSMSRATRAMLTRALAAWDDANNTKKVG